MHGMTPPRHVQASYGQPPRDSGKQRSVTFVSAKPSGGRRQPSSSEEVRRQRKVWGTVHTLSETSCWSACLHVKSCWLHINWLCRHVEEVPACWSPVTTDIWNSLPSEVMSSRILYIYTNI